MMNYPARQRSYHKAFMVTDEITSCSGRQLHPGNRRTKVGNHAIGERFYGSGDSKGFFVATRGVGGGVRASPAGGRRDGATRAERPPASRGPIVALRKARYFHARG